MRIIIVFLLSFILSFILFSLLLKRKEKKEILEIDKLIRFIIKKYKLPNKKKMKLTISKILVPINSLIVAIPFTLFTIIKINYVLVMVISLVIMICLMLILYNLVGYILMKKGDKHGNKKN